MCPKVICHIMSSVDGRLLPERWTLPFDGKDKGELLGVYAAIGRKLGADAWMFGKNTLTEGYFPRKFHAVDSASSELHEAYVAPRSSERLFVVADPDADILYESPTVRGDDIVAVFARNGFGGLFGMVAATRDFLFPCRTGRRRLVSGDADACRRVRREDSLVAGRGNHRRRVSSGRTDRRAEPCCLSGNRWRSFLALNL